MKIYSGTKFLKAEPLNKADYCELRGWSVPEDEDPYEEGYLVEYLDGGQANHIDYDGYISWSPKKVFENSYSANGSMNFGDALKAIKEGKRVARSGWNGKGMFLFLVNGSKFIVNREPLLSIMGEGTEVNYHAHIDMKTADGQVVPWLCSQTDMLASDWEILGD